MSHFQHFLSLCFAGCFGSHDRMLSDGAGFLAFCFERHSIAQLTRRILQFPAMVTIRAKRGRGTGGSAPRKSRERIVILDRHK